MLHDGSGMGALTGSMAALLALRGFQGAPAITVEDPAVADIWADLGEVWTVELNYIKPYPICRWAHAPLDALAAVMKAHKLHAKDIVHLHVRTFAESAALYPGVPETTGQAQYSLAFSLAVLMHHGHVGPEHIAGDGLKDRQVAALLDRITVAEDARHSKRFPLGRWADLTVTLTDGTTLASGDMHARGGPESPMSEAEIEAKLMSFASPTLGQERAAKLWAMRRALLREGALFSDLAALVTPAP
jgi:2-methylcitrate dehydratase PrpD